MGLFSAVELSAASKPTSRIRTRPGWSSSWRVSASRRTTRVAVQGVAPERLDDDGARRNAILTEKRYAGPAGGGGSVWARSERRGTARRSPHPGRRPGAGTKGRLPSRVVRGRRDRRCDAFGRERVGYQAGDFLKVLLTGVEIADDDLQLREAVPQRAAAGAIFGQPAEAGDQILDGFAFAFAAQRHAVARPDGAGVQVVASLEIDDRLVEFLIRLAQFVKFRLDVEHFCFLA